MPRNKERAAAPEQKIILSPNVARDVGEFQHKREAGKTAITPSVAKEAPVKKEKSLTQAMRDLQAEEDIDRAAAEGDLAQVTEDELEKSFGIDKMESAAAMAAFEGHARAAAEGNPSERRIANTNAILGQARAADMWEAATKQFGASPERATEYVHAVADLLARNKIGKLNDLNRKFEIPYYYDPISGSGGSRPTAMRSLRGRSSAPELVGSPTEMPQRNLETRHAEGRRKQYETLVATHLPERPATREETESVLIRRYGIEPAQVYFKLGNVKPETATRMQGDPEYQRWVMELRKTTGAMLKEEARALEDIPKHHKGALLGEEGTEAEMERTGARLAKGLEEETERKFFEAGDRLTREAEEQRNNLLELREELHADIADLMAKPRTPAVQKHIEATSKRIARTEALLQGGEAAELEPLRPSFFERLASGWRSLFAKKPTSTDQDAQQKQKERQEAEPRIGTINERLKTDVEFRNAFQHVLNALPSGEPRAAIDMVHKKLDLPFNRTPDAEIRTPQAIEYVKALAAVLTAKSGGGKKAQAETVSHLMTLNRELDVTDHDPYWKKFMANHLAGWLWKKEAPEAEAEPKMKEEMPEVVVGDEHPPGLPEIREAPRVARQKGVPRVIVGDEVPPAVKEARKRMPKAEAQRPVEQDVRNVVTSLLFMRRQDLSPNGPYGKRLELLQDARRGDPKAIKGFGTQFAGWTSADFERVNELLQQRILTETKPKKNAPEPKRAAERIPRPPSGAEIEGRALLEFQRTLKNPSLKDAQREQAMFYLIHDLQNRADSHTVSAEYPGWRSEHYAKAADALRTAMDEWKRKPVKRPRTIDVGKIPAAEIPETPATEQVGPPSDDDLGELARHLALWENSKNSDDRALYAKTLRNLHEASQGRSTHGYFTEKGYRGWKPKNFRDVLAIHESMKDIEADLEMRLAKKAALPKPPTAEEFTDRLEGVLKKTGGKTLSYFQNELGEYVKHLEEGSQPTRVEPIFLKIIENGYRGWRVEDFRKLHRELNETERTKKGERRQNAKSTAE